MPPKRRKSTPRIASHFSIASPLLLLVSTSFMAPARANQVRELPYPAEFAVGHRSIPIIHGFARLPPYPDYRNPSGNHPPGQDLLIPASILDTRDSGLIRSLLLSHGVELDLGWHDASRSPYKLVVADASGTINLPDQPVGCLPDLEEDAMEAGVSKKWKVLWVGSCEVVVPDPQTDEPGLAIINTPAIDLGSLEVQPEQSPPGAPTTETAKRPAIDPAKLQEQKNTGQLVITDDVPEGFEALAGAQTNFVDIIFNGSKVGATSITSTPGEFQFDFPGEVAQLLPDIIDPSELESLLALPMADNVDRICYGDDDPPGCGQVLADPIAAIYDESRLTVELFVQADLQKVQTQLATRYLSAPERKATSIFSLQAVGTDFEDNPDTLDLSGRAVVGFGRGNIQSEFDYSSAADRRRLRTLKLTHYFQDHELQLGTYSYQPRGGLADFDLLGIDFSTSLKTRVDLEHAFSTELVVYLPRRSVVQLAVDDRVYTGDSYPAGNQALDTRALPDGTYQVEIRILDPVSGNRTERRLFTKSTQIPPRGELQYQVTAGVPLLFNDDRFFPDRADTSVVGGSVAARINDQSAYWFGLLQFGSRTFLQSEYLYLGDRISFQFTSSVARDNTLASSFRTSYSRNNITTNLSYDFFESDFEAEPGSALEPLFPADFRQLSFSLSKSLDKGSLGLRSSYRREATNEGKLTLNQYALFYRRPVFRRKHIQGMLETNLQQDEDGRRINIQFRAFFNNTPLNGSLLTETAFDEQGDRSYAGSLGVNWHHDSASLFDIDLGGYVSATDNDRLLGVSAAVEHPWFTSGLATDWNNVDRAGYRRSSIATLSAHAGADTRGVALGGSDFAQAGVIVAIKGEPRGETFDIIVNGIKASTGEIGKSQFIGLQPFEQYKVKLIPQTVLSNGIGEEIYEFTLYPGNVQRIETVAKKQVLLIATLVNKYGELVENAVVERESNPLLIEDGGFFQAEVTPGERIVVKPANAAPCEFVVPESGDEEVLVLDTPLLCEETASQQATLH